MALPQVVDGFAMALEGSAHRRHFKAVGSAAWGHNWMLRAQELNSSMLPDAWVDIVNNSAELLAGAGQLS